MMQCKHCNCPLEDDSLFCPMCGEPVEQYGPDVIGLPAQNDMPDSGEDFRALADQLDQMEAQPPAEQAPAYEEAAYAYDAYAYQPQSDPEQQAQPTFDYADAYQYPDGAGEQTQPPLNYDDGYNGQPQKPAGKYKKTSVGKRIGSIFLCILMASLFLYVTLNVSLRLTLTKDNIKEATRVDKLLDQKMVTDHGEMTAVEYINRVLGSEKLKEFGITEEDIRSTLRNGRLSNLLAVILSDYTAYVLNDTEPIHLNAAYITSEAEAFNRDLSEVVGKEVTAFSTEQLTKEINGGDLSFLSIDKDGGYFYRHYQVNPRFPATFISLPVLIICAVIVLLCMVLLFAINSSNLPAALNFNGVVLIVIGFFTGLISIGCFILTIVEQIWIVTDLLRQMALWAGVIGGSILLIGIAMLVVAGILRKKAARAARAAA